MVTKTRSAIFAEIKASLGGFPFVPSEVAELDAMMDRRDIPAFVPEQIKPLPGTGKAKKLYNEIDFYKAVRKIAGGKLDDIQVATIKGLLESASHWPIFHIAYGFATAYWEAHLKPIDEIGKGRTKRYGKPMKYAEAPYGRGLVQLTWDDNYEWADEEAAKAGLIQKGDILRDFDLVKRPDIAALVLVKGMEQGAFAKDDQGKHSLNRHIKTGTYEEYLSARRIINGVDRKVEIANLAIKFLSAFQAGEWK